MKGDDGKTYTHWNGKPGEETEPDIVEGEGVHGVVVEMGTNGVAGYTTYKLLLALNDVRSPLFPSLFLTPHLAADLLTDDCLVD